MAPSTAASTPLELGSASREAIERLQVDREDLVAQLALSARAVERLRMQREDREDPAARLGPAHERPPAATGRPLAERSRAQADARRCLGAVYGGVLVDVGEASPGAALPTLLAALASGGWAGELAEDVAGAAARRALGRLRRGAAVPGSGGAAAGGGRAADVSESDEHTKLGAQIDVLGVECGLQPVDNGGAVGADGCSENSDAATLLGLHRERASTLGSVEVERASTLESATTPSARGAAEEDLRARGEEVEDALGEWRGVCETSPSASPMAVLEVPSEPGPGTRAPTRATTAAASSPEEGGAREGHDGSGGCFLGDVGGSRGTSGASRDTDSLKSDDPLPLPLELPAAVPSEAVAGVSENQGCLPGDVGGNKRTSGASGDSESLKSDDHLPLPPELPAAVPREAVAL